MNNPDRPSPPAAVIFGAAGGIGSALARMLAARNWRLLLAGRRPEPLEELSRELGAEMFAVDATDSTQTDAAFDKATGKFGRLDGVVNCCGSILLKPLHLTRDEEWHQTIAANLTTSFHILRGAAGRMMRSGGGSVVLVSSAVARHGMINHEAIAAAKAGVVGLAQSAAATYARYQVRVNCVAPGLVRTPMSEFLTRSESSLKASAALHPLGRIGEASEVASAIAWLLDPGQQWVTGQVIGVDGGLSSIQARSPST